MSVTSKSPVKIVLAALAAARRSLPTYRCKCSPKKFTQHQLFACLILKSALKLDYRGVRTLILDSSEIFEALGIYCVPHYTTLQKASRRLLAQSPVRRLLTATVRMHLKRRKQVARSAVDSTGLECTSASPYFVKRRVRKNMPWKTVVYHRFAKLGLVCDSDDHFVLGMTAGRGPRPDVDEFRPLVDEALRNVQLATIAADAGYDSEGNHRYARQEHGIRTIIPAKHGRPTDKLPSGKYRRLMKTRFDRQAYRRRSQVETVMSMIKRRQGVCVRGRTYHSKCRDLRLMALTHNIMILKILRFSTEPDGSHIFVLDKQTAKRLHSGLIVSHTYDATGWLTLIDNYKSNGDAQSIFTYIYDK